MVLTIIESEQSGIALTDTFIENITTLFNPESIRIHTKNFSLSLLSDMMDRGYIRATPDFHRNMVWNTVQKSRLIESILLRIPLPMFYFSEDDEGFITIIDGMQRLTTIKEFMDNKFPLSHLEYLSICEGKYYSSSKNGSTNEKPVIETKYLRVFNTTQITANVIDPSSPPNVKYDIFKRVNTGGKTLNSQEIRWYLASSALRITLQKMTESDTFKWATGNSIRSTRMEDRAIALRFISFYNYYTKDKTLENYNGNMEMTLDDAAELFSKSKAAELGKYVHLFDNSMKNAAHLFGNTYAFRKVLPQHLEPTAYKQLINKALFVSCSVLLSQYDPEELRTKTEWQVLVSPLAELIKTDKKLSDYLSYGTNGKANIQYTFNVIENLIKQYVNY